MPNTLRHTLSLASPDETERFARRLAPRLGPGDTLLLEGPVGAGKSHFARALIKERLAQSGQNEDVPSPTYTLVQTYAADGVEIWHADLYRVSGPMEVVELGLEEAFDSAICLIEWPDRLGDLRPASAVSLAFHPGPHDDARRVEIEGPAIWGMADAR